MEYLIVSAATEGSRYVSCLDRQAARYGDMFHGSIVKDQGSWEDNTKIKPDVILAGLDRADNVLWIDSDCTIDPPDAFPSDQFDVGIIDNIVATHKCRMSAAFLLFRNTDGARRFLHRWKENNKQFKKDHPALKHTISELDGDVWIANVTPWLAGRHRINDLAPERKVATHTFKAKDRYVNQNSPAKAVKPTRIKSPNALFMPCRPGSTGSGWPALFPKGAQSCGFETTVSLSYIDGYDWYVFWGMRRPHGRQALASGKKCIVVERAYLGDRFHWHAVGLNGLNGRADFNNADVPDDRWTQHWADKVKPWRDGGDYALIIGQVFGDAALQGTDPYAWAEEQAREAAKRYARVYWRPHPLCKRKRHISGAVELHGDESAALSGAACVITHSSNFGVLAAMAGVPVVATDCGSMVYSIASHAVSEPLRRPDRYDWGRRIAYAQWTPDELADGSAWRHITRSSCP